MRILLVGNHWTAGPGGAETMLVLTSTMLRQAGHEVEPFAVTGPRTLPAATAGSFPRAAGEGARTRAGEALAGVWSRRAFAALTRLLDQWRPDVVHVHHVYERLTLSVLDALRRRGVPTVMTLHDYKPVCPNYRLYTGGEPCTRCLSGRYVEVVRNRCLEGSRWRSVAAAADAYLAGARDVYGAVGAFVAPSAFLRDRVVEGGLPAERVRVLPNPVVAAPAPRGEPPAGAPALFAGRFVAEKGIGTLLDAAALLGAGAPAGPPGSLSRPGSFGPPGPGAGVDGVRLRMVGSGRLDGQVRRRVAVQGLPVELAGPSDPAGVAHELRAAACAVVPSTWWENCPMAVLEAAGQGVPVVASAVGGIPELVEDGGTGLLVPPGDAAALAEAVGRLVRDPAEATALGKAAWERAVDRHDPRDHVDRLLDLYQEVRET